MYQSLKSFSNVIKLGKHRCVQNRKTVSLIQLNFNTYYLNIITNLRGKCLLDKRTRPACKTVRLANGHEYKSKWNCIVFWREANYAKCLDKSFLSPDYPENNKSRISAK
jgi:hypothetical protein